VPVRARSGGAAAEMLPEAAEMLPEPRRIARTPSHLLRRWPLDVRRACDGL